MMPENRQLKGVIMDLLKLGGVLLLFYLFAMFVAIVTAPGSPARVMISASFSWCLAFKTL